MNCGYLFGFVEQESGQRHRPRNQVTNKNVGIFED